MVIAITLTLIYAVTLSSIIEADESSKSVTIPFEQNYEVDFPILSILSVHECPLDWKYYIFFLNWSLCYSWQKCSMQMIAPQLKKISLVLMATSLKFDTHWLSDHVPVISNLLLVQCVSSTYSIEIKISVLHT